MTDSLMAPDYLDEGYILESVTLKEDGRILLTYVKKEPTYSGNLIYRPPVTDD